MVIDFLLNPILNFINFILSPLNLITWTIDTIINIPLLTDFFKVIAYIIPWAYIYPLIIMIFSIIAFKIGISLLTTIVKFIPFF